MSDRLEGERLFAIRTLNRDGIKAIRSQLFRNDFLSELGRIAITTQVAENDSFEIFSCDGGDQFSGLIV